ncbi:MAG TPA: serine--tRNA ligase, partial [Actinomycetota bacterium]|nr:serine--tRNA ligase [Actinomycetota bacterium]
MIDLKILREELDHVREAYERRGGVDGVDRVVELDSKHRALLSEVEQLRAEQNRSSKAIGKASPEERPAAIARAKELSDKLKELEPTLEEVADELNA